MIINNINSISCYCKFVTQFLYLINWRSEGGRKCIHKPKEFTFNLYHYECLTSRKGICFKQENLISPNKTYNVSHLI